MTSSAVPFGSPVRRGSWAFVGVLAALTALGWGWSLQLARAGHHCLPLSARVLMWTAMMVGMMVPPEVPTLARLARDEDRGRWVAAGAAAALLGGYLAVWALASAGLAVLEGWLADRGLMTHEMASRSVPLSVGILLAAGLMQLSSWKSACLGRCRSVSARLRDGEARPLTSGVRHGLTSVSSCGVLMLVLLVVGAMNWLAMGLLTALLVAERLVPSRVRPGLGRLTGAALLCWSGWLTVSAVIG